jgi:hypothetical protein
MYKVSANQIVTDIRAAIGDEELMKKHELPLKVYQRLLQMLVNENAVDHGELYEKSPIYRAITDSLTARRSPRAYVPIAMRVYNHETSQKGFLRDLSESGLRVAGIQAQIGRSVSLSLPLKEIASSGPLEFNAVCRWTETQGKAKKYPVAGFEITDISETAKGQLRELVNLFRSQSRWNDRTLYVPLNMSEVLESTRQMRAETESRQFSGTVGNVDILDFVQFMLLSGKKALLNIESSEGDACELHLQNGRIVHAHQGDLEGREAFFECMSFPGGKFSTAPWQQPSRHTVDEPGDFLLVEAARRRDDSASDIPTEEEGD